MLTKKKALITGSAGFIAPFVIREFVEQGYEVIAVDKQEVVDQDGRVEYLRRDVRDLSISDLAGVDIVGHFAFLTNIPFSISSPCSTTDENIGITTRLLSVSTQAKVRRFLYPSTASLYGKNQTPWTEDMAGDALEPYSFQKLSTEILLKMWTKRYGLETATLRLFQVYADRPRSDGVLAAFIRAKQAGSPMMITETSSTSAYKSARRDFIHLSDVARAFYAAAVCPDLREQGPIFNIGTGIATEIRTIADMMGGEIKYIPSRGYEVENHLADLTKTESVLNWKASVNFIDWLGDFVNRNYGV